jgi:hypothetical protein
VSGDSRHRSPAPRRTALAVAVGLLVLAAAACGDARWKPSSEATANARATVETWLNACWRENGEAALVPLTPAEREIAPKGPGVLEGCEQVARLAPRPVTPDRLRAGFTQARVEDVKVNAGFGTATVRSPIGPPVELDLELDRGRWQLSHPQLPGR